MSLSGRICIGAVSYLNTKPLVFRLQQLLPDVQLIYDVPSRLADQLSAGSLDVALIPSIEALRDPGYTIVSDACIGCRGPVWSVKLLSRVPLDRIRTLALDEGSRTSVALAQILLQQQFGRRPQLRPFALGADPRETQTDAVLMIGDRAMRDHGEEFINQWDLGDQWFRRFELPFVFAMWTARQGVDLEPLAPMLSQARDLGLDHLDEIVAAEAPRHQLSVEQCDAYFRHHLHFGLGPEQRQGLQTYYQLAAEMGLAPRDRELKFHDCTATR